MSESVPKSCWDKRGLILLLFLRSGVLGFKGVSDSGLSGDPTANSLSSSGGGRGADGSGGHPEFVYVSMVADGRRRASLTGILTRGSFRGTSFHGRRVTPGSSGLSRGSSPGIRGEPERFRGRVVGTYCQESQLQRPERGSLCCRRSENELASRIHRGPCKSSFCSRRPVDELASRIHRGPCKSSLCSTKAREELALRLNDLALELEAHGRAHSNSREKMMKTSRSAY